MPELPEVETLARSLSAQWSGKIISGLRFHREDLRTKLDQDSLLRILAPGVPVLSVARVGKKIKIDTPMGSVVLGLGMTGHFVIRKRSLPIEKHEHFTLVFSDGTHFGYVDPRRFGSFEPWNSEAAWISAADPLLPESLACFFLSPTWRNSKRRVWDALLDQNGIGGLGNIYALEALFEVGISPEKPCKDIAPEKLFKLALCIPPILRKAIASGGSSISSYRKLDGLPGDFQDQHRVYGREDEECCVCQSIVVRKSLGSRSVYFCPGCQPLRSRPKTRGTSLNKAAFANKLSSANKTSSAKKAASSNKTTASDANLFSWKPGEFVELVPLEVPKPWGREIWFSGIEKRGVNSVRNELGQTLLLPDFVGKFLNPNGVFSPCQVPLIKILDPKPVPVLGDLYTEVHTVKNEVYVCLSVDSLLAQEGKGGLRFGFQMEKGESWEQKKMSFLESTQDYEKVRREIDDLLVEQGVYSGSPPEAEELRSILDVFPKELVERESTLRKKMNAHTNVYPFAPGDFARVPTGVPHALQAGVRVVEFQTNSYERLIVSFAQKVATQDHWDTEKALQNLSPSECFRSPIRALPSEPESLNLLSLFPEYALFWATEGTHRMNEWKPLGAYCVGYVYPGSRVVVDGQTVRGEAFLFVPSHHKKIEIFGRGCLVAFAPSEIPK